MQSNIGKLNTLFRGTMIIVDNNKANDDVEKSTFKEVKRLLKKRVTNSRASQWIEMEMKNRGITKKPKGF